MPTFAPADKLQKSAFGETMAVQPSPEFILSFPYNINTQVVETRENSLGTVTQTTGHAMVSSGASATSAAYMRSRRLLRYEPGRGALIRFAGMFTTGAANSVQNAGYGSTADGFFFGYSGTSFGVLRRYGGARETRTLTITSASSNTENATVTLDGVTKLVAVTNSGVITTTVNELAAGDYSKTGKGWTAEAHGNTVIFRAFETSAHAGAYSVSGTSIVGTFAQTIAAATPSETFTASSSWNLDKADGKSTLPVIDPTMGNVYQIRFQWLGHGAITFSIENPVTGEFIPVHRIQYANSATTPSIANPSLPFFVEAVNTSNTSSVSVMVSSAGGYVEGQGDGVALSRGFMASKTGITTEAPVGSIKNLSIYQSKSNRVPIRLGHVTVASDGTKSVLVKMYKNAAIVAETWTAVEANASTMVTDSAATSFTGGRVFHGVGLAKIDNMLIDLKNLEIFLYPGESFTVTASSGASVDMVVGFSWLEEF